MTGPDKDEKGARGFEGLGDLLSDEPETPRRPDSNGRATRSPQADKPPQSPEEPPPRSTHGPADAGTNHGTAPPLPVQSPSRKSVPWGWIAAGAGVIVIILVNLDDQSSAPPIQPTTTTGLFGDLVPPNDRPGGVESQSGTPVTRAESAVEWNEIRPPVGQDRVLTRDQIRYCVAESVRIEAMEKIVNEYDQSDVDTFNGYVDDYNGRCGSFRYRSGALESVQREVDAVRSPLGQEGRARLRGSQGASNQQRRAADPTVEAVQARLNVLGYNVGVPDGVAGTRTSEAIKSFQLDQGMAVDGVASDRLLEQLIRAVPREDGGGDAASSAESVALPQSTTPSTRDAPAQRGMALGALREDERQSLEAACSTAKYMQGPVAYNSCVTRQLAALKSAPRARDASDLNEDERQSLEAACSTAKYMQGPAAYNACITRQLSTLQSAPRGHDLSGLNEDELQSLEAACSTEKYMTGPSAYNTCISRQLTSLRSAPRAHDFSGLSQSQIQSLESACSTAKYMQGPAAYNRCLSGQLSSLRR